MMITWNLFPAFALPALLLWGVGAVAALRRHQGCSRAALWLMAGGCLLYIAFVAGLWMALQRPPLRTMGETRLWYALFMLVSGWLVYGRWHYRWMPLFSGVVAAVFVVVNLLHPELHDRSLMPALQSLWFVPHVTVYIFSYSLFGCAFLLALAGLWRHTSSYLDSTDRLVSIGLAFLTFGMFSGAIWAKQAWGHYWSWDPKETWAAATWCAYLFYLHHRLRGRHSAPSRSRVAYIWLVIGFLLLQMCWYGVNLLPVASASMHSYD